MQERTHISCFIRHPDGTVTCPVGHDFPYLKRHRNVGKIYRNRDVCRQCLTRCTTATHREVCFSENTTCIATRVEGSRDMTFQPLPAWFRPHNSFYRKDLQKAKVVLTIPADKQKLRTRMCTVEHPFGTIKWYHGAHFALLKGRTKVAAEFALSFLVYNMNRVIRLLGHDPLLRLLKNKKMMKNLCRSVS